MILHIADRRDWESAQRLAAYSPPGLASEGFIHCSTAEQLVDVANAFFRGRRDLVLLVIDEARLRPALKWEPPADAQAGSALFPHVYGPLNLDAVARTLPFEPGADGLFKLPPLP